jgi:hypothetical protein
LGGIAIGLPLAVLATYPTGASSATENVVPFDCMSL